MKFETFIHKIVKNHQQIFCKDRCTQGCTWGVNVRAPVLSRRNARAHVYASCAPVFAQIFTKTLLMILYYLMNISLKFHRDQNFCCGDVSKTILTFKTHQFSMYFPCFLQLCTSKVFKDGYFLDNYGIFWKLDIKMSQSNAQKDTCPRL